MRSGIKEENGSGRWEEEAARQVRTRDTQAGKYVLTRVLRLTYNKG